MSIGMHQYYSSFAVFLLLLHLLTNPLSAGATHSINDSGTLSQNAGSFDDQNAEEGLSIPGSSPIPMVDGSIPDINPDLTPVFADDNPVPSISGSPLQLKFPWAGGLNSCQFVPIDLNLDGHPDLLVFDRHGNRKLTFLHSGIENSIDYTFAPEYALKLPELKDWIQTADYNCDGKMDLFTYHNGGVRVYRNASEGTLAFQLVTNLLESFYYSGKVGILVTSVDYPAFSDIDGDGDLDLLTFFGLGSFVEYHKNLSKEKYGTCDSLDFRLTDPCWGKFKESESGNRITLNVECPYSDAGGSPGQYADDSASRRLVSKAQQNPTDHSTYQVRNRAPVPRHTGSSLLATDLNGDGLKDLIIGDVDYPGLIALFNGGTPDSARIVSMDTLFPAVSKSVRLFSFPNATVIDIDHDGINDLICSPFDPALFTADNYNSVWFYKNTGSNTKPEFSFVTDRFFRSEMMDFGSASYPVLYDFDGDGLTDLFTGCDGYYDSSYYSEGYLHSVYTSRIAYFRNTGSTLSPVFSNITSDLAKASALRLRGLYPAPGDLNGDGRTDLLCGTEDGSLVLFLNKGGSGSEAEFEAPVRNYQNIDVGEYSAPQLYDLDKDSRNELVIGERNGNLNLYKNTGTDTEPVFQKVTDSLGFINVTNYMVSYDGFSTPCFSQDPEGATILLVGSEEGRIHLYGNIDNNLLGRFTEMPGLYEWLSPTPGDTLFGWRSSPAIGKLTDPSEFDLITGNFAGGMNYLTKRSPAEIIPGIPEKTGETTDEIVIVPNPADQTVSIYLNSSQKSAQGMNFGTESGKNRSKAVLYNVTGDEVLSFIPGDNTLISTTLLPDGIYFIRYGSFRGKLMIRHP